MKLRLRLEFSECWEQAAPSASLFANIWRIGKRGMTDSKQKYTAEHWLSYAQEVRAKARGIKDPKIRHEMEIIARLYESLARHAERRMPVRPGGWGAGLPAEDDLPARH
jgi:hypothetical protein